LADPFGGRYGIGFGTVTVVSGVVTVRLTGAVTVVAVIGVVTLTLAATVAGNAGIVGVDWSTLDAWSSEGDGDCAGPPPVDELADARERCLAAWAKLILEPPVSFE
jgi:hypothetical protein